MTRNDLLTLAQRLREYNHNPHHINPTSEAFHNLIAESASAISMLATPPADAADMGGQAGEEVQQQITIVQYLDTKGSRKALGAMNAKLRCKVGHLERRIAEQCEELEILHKQLDRFREKSHGIPALAEHERLSEELAQHRQQAGKLVEAVDVVAWRIGFPDGSGYKVYEQPQEWANQNWGTGVVYEVQDLMTVAQHQRITAAMAAEVERLKQQIDNYRSQFCELHIARNLLSRLSRAGFEIGDDLAASIIALRAELAEVKGREAVAEVVHCNEATGHFHLLGMRRLQVGTKLYTTPPASPDVEGLVKALTKTVASLDQLLPYLGKIPADVGLINDALVAARPLLEQNTNKEVTPDGK